MASRYDRDGMCSWLDPEKLNDVPEPTTRLALAILHRAMLDWRMAQCDAAWQPRRNEYPQESLTTFPSPADEIEDFIWSGECESLAEILGVDYDAMLERIGAADA